MVSAPSQCKMLSHFDELDTFFRLFSQGIDLQHLELKPWLHTLAQTSKHKQES